jgi:hypothetical protein
MQKKFRYGVYSTLKELHFLIAAQMRSADEGATIFYVVSLGLLRGLSGQ